MYNIEDLVKAGKEKVRVTPDLMAAYLELFEKKFGRKPDCAGCTFQSDWNKLTQNITVNKKAEPMPDKTFRLRDPSKIYSYDYKDKKTGRLLRKRRFGYTMEEEFAEEYLTHGTPDELEKRKTEFKILPEEFRQENSEQTVENMQNEPLVENIATDNKTNEATNSTISGSTSSLDNGLPVDDDLISHNPSDIGDLHQEEESTLENTPAESSEEPPDNESVSDETKKQKSKRLTPNSQK